MRFLERLRERAVQRDIQRLNKNNQKYKLFCERFLNMILLNNEKIKRLNGKIEVECTISKPKEPLIEGTIQKEEKWLSKALENTSKRSHKDAHKQHKQENSKHKAENS